MMCLTRCTRVSILRSYQHRNQSTGATSNRGIQFNTRTQSNGASTVPGVAVIEIKDDYGLPSYADAVKAKY